MQYAFASAVGKRHFSERLNSTGKAAIIEHHRSVQWAGKQYMQLLELIQQSQGTLQAEIVDWFSKENPVFIYYCSMIPV